MKTIDTVDPRPFKKLIMTIGELPTSFLESMTYYEMLAWFVDYLQNTIIPSVNNNAEALRELQTAFVTLKNYVDNYFANLDVQEEINNKLDAMVEDGTLTQLIAQFLSLNAVMSFPSVADMKLAQNLVDGSTIETYGYYSANDGGGAKYLVREVTNQDTVDEMTLFALYDVNLVAELIIDTPMNVKQFGAKGDGTTDDTTRIQGALDNSATVLVPKGTYMVDAITKIKPNTNNKLILDNDATLKAITNSETNYAIIWCEDVTDVEICGGTLQGERDTHTGSTGEWGHCIRLYGDSDRIYIHDINLINAWGDGIACVVTGSVRTERVHVKNVRRNGYSIAAVQGFTSTDDIIEDTNGTAPQYGVDIEPDTDTQVIKDVVFNNLTTRNNASGGFQIHMFRNNSVYANIEVNDYHSENEYRGLWLETNATHTGEIVFNNPYISNTTSTAIFIRNHGTSFVHKLIRPVVNGYGVSSASSAGIIVERAANATCGNIYILEPTVKNPIGSATTTLAISVVGKDDSGKYKDVSIIDPLFLDGRLVGFNDASENVIVTDKYNTLNYDSDANATFGSQIHTSATTNTFTANRRIDISSVAKGVPIGIEYEFLNTGSYNLDVRFTNLYIYPLSDTTSKTVTITGKGSLKIKRISSTEWLVLNQSGTITTN